MLLFWFLAYFIEGGTDDSTMIVEKLADDVEVCRTPPIGTIHRIH